MLVALGYLCITSIDEGYSSFIRVSPYYLETKACYQRGIHKRTLGDGGITYARSAAILILFTYQLLRNSRCGSWCVRTPRRLTSRCTLESCWPPTIHSECSNQQLAQAVGTSDRIVRKWRKRWTETQSLEDAPRSGAPRRFSP